MSTLSSKVARRIAGQCLHCKDPALEGSDFCGPHDARDRANDAKRKRRKRIERAKAGLCITGCGRRVSKKTRRARRGRGARIKMLRCSACIRVHKKQMQERREKTRGVRIGVGGVPTEASDPRFRVESDLRPERAGQTTLRYIGKGRRGRLTREEQAAEDKRDAMFAIDGIKKFIAAVDVVMSDEVQSLPPIQLQAAKREAAQHLGNAGRFLDALAERYE